MYLALAPGFGHDLSHDLGAILSYALVGAALVAIGFVAQDLTTPGKLNHFVRDGLPNAVTIASGGTLSLSFIVAASIFASSGHLGEGILRTASYGLLGVLVQVFAIRLLEAVLKINTGALLASRTFSPASIAIAAAHLALGLIVAVSVL